MKSLFFVTILLLFGSSSYAASLPKQTSYKVVLTWEAPTDQTDPVVGYNMYRGTSSYTKINTSLITPLTYTDTTVSDGKSYNYYATSVDAQANESAPSNTYTASIPAMLNPCSISGVTI